MARRVSTKTGASAPSKGFKAATGKGRGGAAAGPGSRKPEQKPQVVAFNESTVDAINRSGPPGHEVAHINPREGRLLKALGGSGEKDPVTKITSYDTEVDQNLSGDTSTGTVSTGYQTDTSTSGGSGVDNYDWDKHYQDIEDKKEKKRLEDIAEAKRISDEEVAADKELKRLEKIVQDEKISDEAREHAIRKKKREEKKAAKLAEEQAEAQAEIDAQAEIEAEAEEKAEKDAQDARDRENILEGDDDGQGDLYEDLDGMLEEPTQTNDLGVHGTVGADGTVYYGNTGEEGENFIKAVDKYYSGDAWDDPDYTGPLEDDINDTSSGEGDSLGGDSGDDAGTGDGGIEYVSDADNEPLGGDSHDEGDDTLGGDTHDGDGGGDSTGGISIDEPLDDALNEDLGGDAGDDTTSIDDTDDDLGNDSEPGGYDPDADDDILGPDNSADGGGSTIDETDDNPNNDLYPNFDDDDNDVNEDEPEVEVEDEPFVSTGDADKDKLLKDLDEKYAEYGETDYEKLYHDEFSDDLKEDYGAASKGLDFNFLTSGNRSEFNTAGNTVNDQQDYLGELLEGDQQDDLMEQAEHYASNPKAAIREWYKQQKKAIEDGTADSIEELDLSEWADPSENYNPEFFGDESAEGEVLYDKRYYDPDKTYYDSELDDPTLAENEQIKGDAFGGLMEDDSTFDMGNPDSWMDAPDSGEPEQIEEPEPGTTGGDEMILPETIDPDSLNAPATSNVTTGVTDTLETEPTGFEGLDDSTFDMGNPNAFMDAPDADDTEPIEEETNFIEGSEDGGGIYSHQNPDGTIDSSGLSDDDKYDLTDAVNENAGLTSKDAGYLFMGDTFFDENGIVAGQDDFNGLMEDDSAFDMGDPNAWMNAPEDKTPDTRVSNKTKPVRARDRIRRRNSSGGSNYSHPST